MNIKVPDTIDFSDTEELFSITNDLNKLEASLPSIVGDKDWDKVSSTSPVPKATPQSTKFDTSAPSKRITIRLSTDVWKTYREVADHRGIPYQTLINETLRRGISSLTP